MTGTGWGHPYFMVEINFSHGMWIFYFFMFISMIIMG